MNEMNPTTDAERSDTEPSFTGEEDRSPRWGRDVSGGAPGDIEPVAERTPGDRFENAIREFGVVAACEWFGCHATSEWTERTIAVLKHRSLNQEPRT